MKNLKSFLAIITLGALAVSAGTASAQVGSKAGSATVIRVQGQVTYSLGDNNWHPLVPGKYLPAGASIHTGYNGTVDMILGKAIELPQAKWAPERISQAPDSAVRGMVTYKPSAEQNMIRLIPNTTLSIDKLTTTDTGADTVNDTELDLKEGKMFASVKKLSGASQYLVKIPNGVAGVRGTWFSLGADGSVAVYESTGGGLILSISMNGTTQTILVEQGQLYDITAGTTSPIPIQLNQTLKEIFTALKMIYIQVVDFTYDHTDCHVSSTSGKGKGGGGGGGGEGGGGNQQ